MGSDFQIRILLCEILSNYRLFLENCQSTILSSNLLEFVYISLEFLDMFFHHK
jgi:hypothetical protein